VDLHRDWAQLLAVAEAPRSAAERDTALLDAVILGTTVVPAGLGCSVTERVGSAYRTVSSANDLSLALDLAQYGAQAGPCLAAADGAMQRVDRMAEAGEYREFAEAALAYGVRSSLSVPLPDPRRPAALNFYAAEPGAFAGEHAGAVADLLARCVATLLPAGTVVVPAERAAPAAVRSRGARVERALTTLMATGLSRAEAFAALARRSREEQRSMHAIVDDLLAGADRTAAS
jgi:uncharacterized protein YoaH (UPF0181 family)